MLIIDVETSGLDCFKHQILSIGCVDLSKPNRTFYAETFLNPGKEYSKDALLINGFTENQIKDTQKKSLRTILLSFIDFYNNTDDKILAGQNVHFDLGFLNQGLKESNIEFKLPHRIFDIHTYVIGRLIEIQNRYPLYYWDENKNKKINEFKGVSAVDSDFISKLCGLPPEIKPHNALNGATREAEQLHRMFRGTGLFTRFSNNPIPEFLKSKG